MTSPGGELGTFTRFLYDRYLGMLWRSYFGSRLMSMLGLLIDEVQSVIADAWLAPLHQRQDGPAYDALRPLGEEMSMPQYPFEDWLNYRSRLRTDWETWDKAGDETTIVNQLSLAGAPGAEVFRFADNDSWSEFVIFYPAGAHTVTGWDFLWGDGTLWGDGSVYGPAGIAPELLTGLKELIIHWKPANRKCTYIVWELSGWTYGTGHTWGEVGLVWGGEQIRAAVQ